jgi:hypothetical protein
MGGVCISHQGLIFPAFPGAEGGRIIEINYEALENSTTAPRHAGERATQKMWHINVQDT